MRDKRDTVRRSLWSAVKRRHPSPRQEAKKLSRSPKFAVLERQSIQYQAYVNLLYWLNVDMIRSFSRKFAGFLEYG